MADDPGIGARIARWRRRRGISQAALAGLVGRSESWLSQVERGTRGVDSLPVLRELAHVLRVDLDELSPPSIIRSRGYGEPVNARIERAILDPGPGEPTSFAQVAAVHADYQAARYTAVLTRLPELVDSLTATVDLRVLTAGWTVVSKILTKIGAVDLALLTADRAQECARRSGDRADLGMATYQVVCALLPGAQASLAEDLAVRTAQIRATRTTPFVASWEPCG
jgi:transcriptional regulator with XRE-family HTH domain